MKIKDLHRSIKIRILESLLSGTVGGMIFPFMAIYLNANFGNKIAGLLLLINVIVGICTSFIGGYFADHFGRKKVMLSAEIVRFFAFFGMLLCNSPWFQSASITFVMMTFNSIAWGFSGPSTKAMLIDVSTPEQRKFMYSITYWVNNLSLAIGAIMGAILFKDYLFELLIALCVVTGFIVILIIYFIEESYSPVISSITPIQHVSSLLSKYKLVLKDKTFISFVFAGVLLISFELQLTNYIGIRLTEEMPIQNLMFWEIDGTNMVGILLGVNTVLVITLMFVVTVFSKHISDKSLLIIGSLIYTFGFSIIAYSNNIWILLIMMFILTLGEVIRTPVEQSYLALIPPKESISSYMALNELKFNLALLIASVTVMVSSFLSSYIIAFFILISGLIATLIFIIVIPIVEEKRMVNT